MIFKLSILLVTYNHEKYIRKAMEGILKQRIEEDIQLIIADDGSSDSTVQIIQEFEERDSRFNFNYLDNKSNLGVTKNYKRGFAACSGEYVAIIEGDDYWVSPFKLQRQKEFLDSHWECDICSVNYFIYNEEQSRFATRSLSGIGYRLLTARELMFDNIVSNFSTCMYRKTALNQLPSELFDIVSYDWIVNICITRYSLAGFLEEPMSVYRLHSSGVWTRKTASEKLKAQIDLIPVYDKLTNYVFHTDFEILSNSLHSQITNSSVKMRMKTITQPIGQLLSLIIDCTPPLFVTIISSIIPPKVKRGFVKILRRSSI